MAIEIRQRTTYPAQPQAHHVESDTISIFHVTDYLQQDVLTASIHEFLLEMRKDGHICWIGVSVAAGTSNFTNVQVFFHPTPTNTGKVIAADSDYPAFTGGWSDAKFSWVGTNGAQLARSRPTTPLIVPFMTDAAYRGSAPAYMFATQPMETLSAIVSAVRTAITGRAGSVDIGQIGVSSFSNGITGLQLFIRTFGSLIVEITDFDSFLMPGSPRIVTTLPRASGRVVTQIPPFHYTGGRLPPGYLYLPAVKFKYIAAYDNAHQRIGRMTFFGAMAQSKIT